MLSFSGCSSFSTSDQFSSAPGAVLTGVPYYLPLGRIHIVGSNSGSQTKTTGSVTPSDHNGSGTPTGTATDPNGTQNNGQTAGQYTIAITAVIEPDPSHLYYLKRNGNYLDDDNITISVNANHLLSTSTATSTDETANIVGQVVSLAESFREGPPLTSPTGTAEPTPFEVTFDPLNQGEVDNARSVIQNSNLTLERIKISDANPHTLFAKDGQAPGTNGEGVAFRLPRVFTIKIDNLAWKAKYQLSAAQNVVLPDKTSEYLLDTSRMPFVIKATQLAFNNGMLTSFSQSVPSPILGALAIPKNIIQAVIIPTGGAPAQGTTTAAKAK